MSALLSRIEYAARAVLSVLRDPTSNLTVAFLTMSIIALLLILVLLALYVLIAMRQWDSEDSGRRADAALDADEAARPRHGRDLLVVGIVVVAAALAASSFSTTDAACARCHYTTRAFESLAKSAHAVVPCAGCHVSGGPSGRALAMTRGAANALSGLGGEYVGPVDASVGDGACVRCHRDVQSETIVAQGIRVSHKEIEASGRACTDCHNTVAHGGSVRRTRYPKMETCLPCHSGEKASSACETCHVDDPGVAVRRLPRGFAKVTLVKEDCRGCHSIKACNDCHGLELPHSREFVQGYHARQALLDKETCLKCHDLYAFCSKGCHNFRAGLADGTRVIANQHAPSFVSWHLNVDPERCAGCHRNPDVCRYCHER